MADVDQCTRLAEAGLCGHTKENALEISHIDNKLRNIIFRDKTAQEIEDMLRRFSDAIKSSVSEKYGFTCTQLLPSSDNNRDSADLFCLLPDCRKLAIEVKFGAYTDKAAGMQSFADIFGTKVFSDALSIEQRKLWAEQIRLEYPSMDAQAVRLISTLNSAVAAFNDHLKSTDYLLPEIRQKFMEDYLLNNSGSFESHSDNYMRFETNKNGSKIILAIPLQKGIGRWRVLPVLPIDPQHDEFRVTVFAINDVAKLKIKFVLNNKNDFHPKAIPGAKIRSKYMLNSPSWNVWVQQLEDPEN